MSTAITLVGLIIALAIAGLLVHLSLTWMSKRGWIWYRTDDRPRPSSLGLIEDIYQPSIEHVMEEQAGEAARADQAESGDGEEPGSPSDP